MNKPVLFIDRDGTIVAEPPVTFQIDTIDQLTFLPNAIGALSKIARKGDYYMTMVTNQDGLGGEAYPWERFLPLHNLILRTLESEGVKMDAVHIDTTFPHENAPTRKPGIAMLEQYFDAERFDLPGSYVIGDRMTDVGLAHNLGCKAILLQPRQVAPSLLEQHPEWADACVLATDDWDEIATFLLAGSRCAETQRDTAETQVYVRLNADGCGRADISTGLHFFDHMLHQLATHGGMDVCIKTHGDLEVDEHHTIEDTAIALGETLAKAVGNKLGMARYGFSLPMDDCMAQVLIDFGGRSWLVWDLCFTREKIGDVPTEMFMHFFKSFSDAARINLNIKAEGTNDHHKIEAVFKALARAIKMALRRDGSLVLPSSKGMLS